MKIFVLAAAATGETDGKEEPETDGKEEPETEDKQPTQVVVTVCMPWCVCVSGELSDMVMVCRRRREEMRE